MILIKKNKIKCPLCKNDITRFQGVFYICPYCKRVINAKLKEKTDRTLDPTGNQYTEYFINEKHNKKTIRENKKRLMNARWYHWAFIIGVALIGGIKVLTLIINNIELFTYLVIPLIFCIFYVPPLFLSWMGNKNNSNHTYINKDGRITVRRFISKDYYCQYQVKPDINEAEDGPDVYFTEIKIDSIYKIETEARSKTPLITISYQNEQGVVQLLKTENVFTPQEIEQIFRKQLTIVPCALRAT